MYVCILCSYYGTNLQLLTGKKLQVKSMLTVVEICTREFLTEQQCAFSDYYC